ncbi:MAG: glycosyltransferase family 4 protein [Acidimicrobiia bacterium]|nr:glycosyltransferase family 4 protein [Acidimicrobiia bacterium]
MTGIRVCHLIHDLGPGGAEHVLVDLARVAKPAGLDMSVVSMLPTEGLRYPEALREAGVTVRSLDLRSWWDPRGPRRLRRVVDELRPQVLHSHLKHADVVAGRVAMRTGIPQVSTLHVIEDDVAALGRLKRAIAMRSRRRTAAMTIAVSDAQRQWYLAMSGEDPRRVVTIRNGIPDPGPVAPAARAAVRAELGIRHDAVAAAMVAVMRPGKGHDVMLAAMAAVDPQVSIVLVGDGELMDAVVEGSRRHLGRVILTGFREDVARLLGGVDLVIHPSTADALPTALVHAAAAGLPVIASAVGGIPEIVTAESGILIGPGDAPALAAAINALAADPARRTRMGEAARRRFEERFTAQRWIAELRAIYETVIAR